MAFKKHFHFDSNRILQEPPSRLDVLLQKLSKGEPLSVDDDCLFPCELQAPVKTPADHVTAIEPDKTRAEITVTALSDVEITPDEEQYGYYIRQDPDLAEAEDYLKTASKFCLLVKNIDWKIRACREKIMDEERFMQDILHECQQPLKNEKDSIALYRLIHRSRRKRQEYKDLLSVLRLLQEYIHSHRSVFDAFLPIVNVAEKRVSNRETRVYMQRSDAMLLPVGDNFRNLSEDEQKRIKANYDQSRQN